MSKTSTRPLPDFARYWSDNLGCGQGSLVRLSGGINNIVFRCGEKTRKQWVIKGYTHLATPSARDRMQAEIDFLRYSAKVAPEFTPELIYVDEERRCIVLEYLHGQDFSEKGEPPKAAISSAIDFINRLNTDYGVARKFIRLDAAEGYLKLTDHLSNIHSRILRMEYSQLPFDLIPDASMLLSRIQKEFELVARRTEERIDAGSIFDSIEAERRCVSPSDFGFHNAKWTESGIKFYDFEFAGWDDPAKTAADFVLQPRVRVKLASNILIDRIHCLKQEGLERRVETMIPILRLKWMCIILAVLDPYKLQHMRSEHHHNDFDRFIRDRLRTAITYSERLEQKSP